MISDRTFKKWGNWPYFQITNQSQTNFRDNLLNRSFVWKNVLRKLVECNI
jgi:hypothetical protein